MEGPGPRAIGGWVWTFTLAGSWVEPVWPGTSSNLGTLALTCVTVECIWSTTAENFRTLTLTCLGVEHVRWIALKNFRTSTFTGVTMEGPGPRAIGDWAWTFTFAGSWVEPVWLGTS